jgi:hypothetical protein
MRISARRDDPGFAPWVNLARVRFWLAGVERTDVITADEERRWALCEARDERGHVIVDGDAVRTVEFYGDVRIELPPLAASAYATGECIS